MRKRIKQRKQSLFCKSRNLNGKTKIVIPVVLSSMNTKEYKNLTIFERKILDNNELQNKRKNGIKTKKNHQITQIKIV